MSQAAPALFSGTPDFFGSGLKPQFGKLINFDDLAPNTQLNPSAYTSQGVQSIANSPTSAPLMVLPFSQQTPPNYVSTGASDNYAGDITITLSGLTDEMGIGIASDGTPIQLIPLGANGARLAPPFTVTVSTAGSTPFNGYWTFFDSSFDIKGLEIISTANLGIDDLQFNTTPEPVSLTLFIAGAALIGLSRLRKRA